MQAFGGGIYAANSCNNDDSGGGANDGKVSLYMYNVVFDANKLQDAGVLCEDGADESTFEEYAINTAGAALFYRTTLGIASNCSFRNHEGNVIKNEGTLEFACPLGTYMLWSGDWNGGDFEGWCVPRVASHACKRM